MKPGAADRAGWLPEFTEGAALVVGGSGGIGSAICRRLAAAGSHVALTYHRNAEAAGSVVADVESAGRDASATMVDITNPQAIKAVVDQTVSRFGSIHSVIYASGPSFRMSYINQIDPADWAQVINADVNGCFNLIWAALPHLRERKRGSILAIVTAAVDRAPPRDILSSAPKAAIRMLMQGVAREEGRNGIRVNCVGPGYVQAGISLPEALGHSPEYIEKMCAAIPLRRQPGEAGDVADAVCFLLSDAAKYITGETLCVAGGLQIA